MCNVYVRSLSLRWCLLLVCHCARRLDADVMASQDSHGRRENPRGTQAGSGWSVVGGWQQEKQQQQRHQRCAAAAAARWDLGQSNFTKTSIIFQWERVPLLFRLRAAGLVGVGVVCYCSQKNESARIFVSVRIEWREINKRHCAGTCASVRACHRPSGNKVVQQSCSLGNVAWRLGREQLTSLHRGGGLFWLLLPHTATKSMTLRGNIVASCSVVSRVTQVRCCIHIRIPMRFGTVMPPPTPPSLHHSTLHLSLLYLTS